MSYLKSVMPAHVVFDVNNQAHLDAYKFFLENSRWAPDAPRFMTDETFISIPHMIEHIITKKFLGITK